MDGIPGFLYFPRGRTAIPHVYRTLGTCLFQVAPEPVLGALHGQLHLTYSEGFEVNALVIPLMNEDPLAC